ncbi:cell division protein [Ralstonia syzygii]|uniref:cell division protein n=1 Tax=Ralstonia syzygii TaxID=28097 RepID=UPI0018D1D0E3|nr:cell division protein [Ralstonia syzygii]
MSAQSPSLFSAEEVAEPPVVTDAAAGPVTAGALSHARPVPSPELLHPALSTLCAGAERIALVGPPYLPNAVRLVGWDVSPEQVVWVRAAKPSDLLWAAEQIVRSQAFGGVLLWLGQTRPGVLRRLQVLAQAGESAIWVFRPVQALRESSPAVLRLGLAPAAGDTLSIAFHKRRGPLRDTPLVLPLADPLQAGRASVRPLPAAPVEPFVVDPATASLSSFPAPGDVPDAADHAVLDRGASASPAARRAAFPVA